MADIFSEVNEEVRRERLKQLWDRYGIFVIALAVLIVAGIGAWRGYEWWQAKKAATAGAQFEHAVSLSEQGKQKEAEAAFDKLAAEAPSGYRTLARFRAAAGLVKEKPAEAVKAYDKLTADPSISPALQDLATVRAGMLQADTVPFDQLKRKLEPVAQPGHSFRATARELLALSAWGHHDYAEAQHYIDLIMGDPETSPGMRNRVEVLSALIAGSAKTNDSNSRSSNNNNNNNNNNKPNSKPAAKAGGKS